MKKIFLLLMLLIGINANAATLTVGNVPKVNTGGSTPKLEDSVISVSGSNVGISTTLPASKLDVVGTVNATGINMQTGNITNVGAISGDTSLNYSFYLSGQLFYWVGSTDDLSTAISNASAGSTIFLAEGTYTEASTMTVDKSLRIIGSGEGKTIISCTMTSSNCFTITASNVELSNLSVTQTISSTGGSTVRFDGSAGTVISGAKLTKVTITSTYSVAATSRAITVTSASGEFYDTTLNVTCSASSSNCYGLQFFGDASQEAAVTLVNNNMKCTMNSSNSNTGICVKVQDSSSTTDNIYIAYGGNFTNTESGGTPTTYAIACDTGTNAVCYLHGGYYKGADQDIRVVNSATMSLDKVTAANGVISTGTMIYDGSIFAGGFRVGPPTAQTIAATNTITADACGGLKQITSAGAVTTSTTDTFTAPSTSNTGCIMNVCNTGTNNITLDNNANFISAGAADVVMTGNDCVIVGSNGTAWYQITALEAN